MTETLPISLITHTYNSGKNIEKLLQSTNFLEDKIIIDMGSDDNTIDLAKKYACRIYHTDKTEQIDSIRNKFINLGIHDWVLALDSDEYLPADAQESLKLMIAVSKDVTSAYAIPRFNTICGYVMRGSGWYPDRQIRLFRKGHVRWQEGHHRLPIVEGGRAKLVNLTPPDCMHIHHNNYETIEEFIKKQLNYALTDDYDCDDLAFDYGKYVNESLLEYTNRLDNESDGQLSHVLAIIMCWDKIIRGIIHWEKLGRKHIISNHFTLPMILYSNPEIVKLKSEVESLRIKIEQRDQLINELQEKIESDNNMRENYAQKNYTTRVDYVSVLQNVLRSVIKCFRI